MVGYNVQTAVDTKHHLIVAHKVTNLGHDRTQLADMAVQAKEATGQEITALADRGYFKGEEILRCDEARIVPLVPKPQTSNNKAAGLFDKSDFVYSAADDAYRCPAGEHAVRRMTVVENGLTLHKYWSSACPTCPLKPRCTTGVNRRIARWEHEAVLERMQARLNQRPQAARERRQTVEHSFATLKAWMGATHFLLRTLPKVRTEMSLHVLAYNMKRVISLLGTTSLIKAMQAQRKRARSSASSGRVLADNGCASASSAARVYTRSRPEAVGHGARKQSLESMEPAGQIAGRGNLTFSDRMPTRGGKDRTGRRTAALGPARCPDG